MIDLLLGGKQSGQARQEIHRFFGAATADGNLDYVPEVTASIPKRYFIKGRPGTGKSTFLKEARPGGLNGAIPWNGITAPRPKSLDLVAVRELGFCLLDSTAPTNISFPSETKSWTCTSSVSLPARTKPCCPIAEPANRLRSWFRPP